jgi:hypothetical protein
LISLVEITTTKNLTRRSENFDPCSLNGLGSNSSSVREIYSRIDNSEWMRNGDYTPTRLEAQNDAVTFLFNAKTQSNPENTVGLITMAGKRFLLLN